MFCWMFVMAVKMRSLENILVQLGWFFGITVFAFAFIWFIAYPGVYFLVVRKNPITFYGNVYPAIIMAFGSGSR